MVIRTSYNVTPRPVAQVSKPAVSPTSKSAERQPLQGLRVWKPAIQQTWKSALQLQCQSAPFLSLARSPRPRGSLIAELLVAMLLLTGVMLPIAYSIGVERGLARLDYHRVVAMEIADGEMETLAAGEWHSYPVGTHPYVVRANSAINLPPGQFLLTVETNRLRLEWRPDGKHHGGPVVREAVIR